MKKNPNTWVSAFSTLHVTGAVTQVCMVQITNAREDN